MYIFKNAMRCISRAKGKTTLLSLLSGLAKPTGNLDGETQQEIMDIFRELANQGKCVILVSHSPEVAAQCDERYELVKVSNARKSK